MSFGEAAVPEVGYSLRGLRRIDQRGSRHSRRAERKRGDGCRLKLWVAGDSATCATGPVLPCWRYRLLTQPFPLQPARLQLQAARHILLAHTRTRTHDTHTHTHTPLGLLTRTDFTPTHSPSSFLHPYSTTLSSVFVSVQARPVICAGHLI